MTFVSARAALGLAVTVAAMLAVVAAGSTPSEETALGTFQGTWFRVDPWERQAVQLRAAPHGKTWEVRLRWQMSEQVTVDTNWAPKVSYVVNGLPATLALAVDAARTTPTRIIATWRRDETLPGGRNMTEEGDVALYRVRDGRSLVWSQDPLKVKVTIPDPIAPYEEDGQKSTSQRLWNMSKAARRLIEWDEIPW